MKKIASLSLALLLALSFAVGVFAAEDVPQPFPMYGENNGTQMQPMPGNMDYDHGDAHGVLPADEFVAVSPRVSWISEDTARIAPGEMFLVQEGQLVRPESLLIPNNEYVFDIFFNATDAAIDQTVNTGMVIGLSQLTEADISGPAGATTTGRLRLRSGRGNTAFSRSEIRTRGSGPARTFQLVLETRPIYNTRQTEATFTLLTSGNLPAVTAPMVNPVLSTISFEVGWARMTDEDVDSYAEGDTVTVSNEYPVIMRRQLERLVRNHNYRPIHLAFEDGSWEYTGRMSGMGDTNFYTTQDVVPALMNRFDQDFKFLSLPAGVTFPTNGEMRIDVSDVSGDWNRIYTYVYRNGTLTPINTTYDSMDDMIYFRTNFLGSFVMTDVEITDLNLIAQPDEPEILEPQEPETLPEHFNPPTGAASAAGGMGNLMMALGTVSLIGVGAVINNRRKK